MDRDEDELLLTFFFALRTILNPDASVEERRQEVTYLRFVHATWSAVYPHTVPLHEISCVTNPADINTTAWELATKLRSALDTAVTQSPCSP